MNKKILVLVIVIILICVAAVLVFKFKNNGAVASNPGTNSQDNEQYQYAATLTVTPTTTEFSNKNMNVRCIIPKFTNLNTSVNNYINSKIEKDLIYTNVFDEVTAGLDSSSIGKFTYSVNYERFNCFDFVSIVATQNIELEGSRSIVRKKCYVVDAKNDRTANLKDVFANKSSYKSKVKSEVSKQAEEKGIELTGGNDIFSIEDTQSFYIKNDKLHIYFEPSEVSAAANGELDFEMPFKLNNGVFEF
ncbi:MAG: DUF3298 domain-containing protein [Clostridia bacterium]|nr:DUF3298 domain-containing protein [Clostridia bacterium]